MTAPDKRRPLPALVVIAALTLLTALVWFRVLHRSNDAAHPAAAKTTCATPTPTTAAPSVLPKPATVTLIVLNSTSRSGLAAGAKKTLVADGFTVSQVTNDAATFGGHGEITGVAEIRFGPSARPAATLLAYYVPGAKLVQTDSSAATVILSLGAKYTALQTPAKVAAAIASARATPSPTPTAATSTAASC